VGARPNATLKRALDLVTPPGGCALPSYESFHRSGLATVCPISARAPRYPGEISIPRGQAGQTLDAVVLCHQVRTVDLARVTTFEVAGQAQRVTDPEIRTRVRSALARHLGLDIPTNVDTAA